MSPSPDHATALVSSVLARLTYVPDATLDLVFQSGAIYRYFAVPPAVVDALIAAESKGAYFNTHVRNRFRYQRLA
jgi:KTSC domain-containing protein